MSIRCVRGRPGRGAGVQLVPQDGRALGAGRGAGAVAAPAQLHGEPGHGAAGPPRAGLGHAGRRLGAAAAGAPPPAGAARAHAGARRGRRGLAAGPLAHLIILITAHTITTVPRTYGHFRAHK